MVRAEVDQVPDVVATQAEVDQVFPDAAATQVEVDPDAAAMLVVDLAAPDVVVMRVVDLAAPDTVAMLVVDLADRDVAVMRVAEHADQDEAAMLVAERDVVQDRKRVDTTEAREHLRDAPVVRRRDEARERDAVVTAAEKTKDTAAGHPVKGQAMVDRRLVTDVARAAPHSHRDSHPVVVATRDDLRLVSHAVDARRLAVVPSVAAHHSGRALARPSADHSARAVPAAGRASARVAPRYAAGFPHRCVRSF